MKHIPTSGYIWENATKVKKRWDWCKLAHTHTTLQSHCDYCERKKSVMKNSYSYCTLQLALNYYYYQITV